MTRRQNLENAKSCIRSVQTLRIILPLLAKNIMDVAKATPDETRHFMAEIDTIKKGMLTFEETEKAIAEINEILDASHAD